MTKFVAKLVALVGAAMILMRRWGADTAAPAIGAAPAIPPARPQSIPTLKMPTAKGWTPGHVPSAAPGLKVNALAAGLDHPRWVEALPNGDVLAAEALSTPGGISSAFDYAIYATMKRADAVGRSANRITLLRDTNQDGVAEVQEIFLSGLNQPFGMALVGDTLYVANTDALLAYSFAPGPTKMTATPRQLASFKPGGHWTRNILPSCDGTRLYIGVGSETNIADNGMAAEEGRACIYEYDIATAQIRIFASGLRNPVGMAWEPTTNTLWTVVNERDGLGDETPPDYLTSVVDGGFYGWPYSYWDQIVDDRVPQDAAKVAASLTPDYALGGHTASLGLCWMPAGTLPGFPDGMVIGQHGSWNRSNLAGYKVIFVPFANGTPSGPSREILSGFLAPDEKVSYGRPVGVAIANDGALLVADDVGNVIWRVTGA
ncbi:MAG: sorbosone dehydrogenase family protein [bacterium]